MALQINYGKHIDKVIRDLPSTVSINGTSYTDGAIVSETELGDDLNLEGIFGDNDITVYIKTSTLVTTPEVGQKVIYSGETYRIKRYNLSPDGNLTTLTCEEATA